MFLLGAVLASALIAAARLYCLHRIVPAVSPKHRHAAVVRSPVVIDVRVCHHPLADPCDCKQRRGAYVTEKDLYLYQHPDRQEAWLCPEVADETELADEALVVTSIIVGERPSDPPSGAVWEKRDGEVWVLKQEFRNQIDRAVTGVDVLYGADAVDPRPQWNLLQVPLQLDAPPEIPAARLSFRRGRIKPKLDAQVLRIPENGKYRIIQISDLHMIAGSGVCKDAMDAHGVYLRPVAADPRTVGFIDKVLERWKPKLVILTGDQVDHDVHDTQTALFKAVAPMEARGIPYATVFGNHDSEGTRALSRIEQMALLQSLPNCLSEPGPEEVDGVGNYIIHVFAAAPSKLPALTLYLLDSHGAISGFLGKLLSKFRNRYDHIKRSQIQWFMRTSDEERRKCEKAKNDSALNLSLAFFHIPLPEFRNCDAGIRIGLRREPTEGPFYNSRFYEILDKQGIAVIGTGHDHLNDFVAQSPQQAGQDGKPNFCSGGSAGFGAYGKYGKERTYRRVRGYDFDANARSLTTWTHVEYCAGKVDELELVKDGVLLSPWDRVDKGSSRAVQ